MQENVAVTKVIIIVIKDQEFFSGIIKVSEEGRKRRGGKEDDRGKT